MDNDREVADIPLCMHDGKGYLCSGHGADLCIAQRVLESCLLCRGQVGRDIACDHRKACSGFEQISCLFDVECRRLGEQQRAGVLIDAKCKKCSLFRVHRDQVLAERSGHK